MKLAKLIYKPCPGEEKTACLNQALTEAIENDTLVEFVFNDRRYVIDPNAMRASVLELNEGEES